MNAETWPRLDVWLNQKYQTVGFGVATATTIDNDWIEELLAEHADLQAEVARLREALTVLSKGNRSPGVLSIAREALKHTPVQIESEEK